MAKPMPVLFVGHGSPMNAIEDNEFSRGWKEASAIIPRPAGILCISAHWGTRGTFITTTAEPETMHDFGGFPESLYAVSYPAKGNPSLAGEIIRMVTKTEIIPDGKRGLDHGAWSVIMNLYPEADIPVVQMSLNLYETSDYHFNLAKELLPLREIGVLVIGSGNIVHNLAMVAWERFNENFGYNWAAAANEKMKEHILDDSYRELLNFRAQGREFKLAIPTAEHFLPLLYVLALKRKGEPVSFFNDRLVAGSLSMTSVMIG
jgi:4,5-DOPA dioxygenase extradiol